MVLKGRLTRHPFVFSKQRQKPEPGKETFFAVDVNRGKEPFLLCKANDMTY